MAARPIPEHLGWLLSQLLENLVRNGYKIIKPDGTDGTLDIVSLSRETTTTFDQMLKTNPDILRDPKYKEN
jgi:hypothetical protein